MDILQATNPLLTYVRPELIPLGIALYFLCNWIKSTEKFNSKDIPMILGYIGIILSTLYIFAVTDVYSYKDILMIIFTGIIQGILTAALSTYIYEFLKQNKKGSK